jgi:hypothetical protein
MIGFEGRHQWRQQKLFKLCAKPPQRENPFDCRWLALQSRQRWQKEPLPKFAIRSICVRCTKIVRGVSPTRSRLNRREKIAQHLGNVIRILVDEEMPAGESNVFRIAEALAPFCRNIEQLSHLSRGAVENQCRALNLAIDVRCVVFEV